MTPRRLLFAGLALVALFPAVGHAADAPAAPAPAAKPEDVVTASLGALKLGEGLVAHQVILFPLILETPARCSSSSRRSRARRSRSRSRRRAAWTR